MRERGKRIVRATNIAVLVAAALAIPVLVLDTATSDGPLKLVAQTLTWSIWIVFAGEAVVLLVDATDRREWVRSQMRDVMIVVLSRPFLPVSMRDPRLLWVLRTLRTFENAKAAARVPPMPSVPTGPITTVLATPIVAARVTLRPSLTIAGKIIGAAATVAGGIVGGVNAVLRSGSAGGGAPAPVPEGRRELPLRAGGYRLDRYPADGIEGETHLIEIHRASVTGTDVGLESFLLGGRHGAFEISGHELDELAASQPRRSGAGSAPS
jgi:hypothetical protein